MATIIELTEKVTALTAGLTAINLKLDAVKAKIDALVAGQVSQEQIDALDASLSAAQDEATQVLAESEELAK